MDEGVRAVLDSLAENPSETWFITAEEPRLAYGAYMGEGEELTGPYLIQDGDGWVELEDITSDLSTLGRRGDWLLGGQFQRWQLYDIRARAWVAEGIGTAWFWPQDVPLP